MYHNHGFEFKKDKVSKKDFITRLAETFTADELSFILDTYWIQFSGNNPISLIKKFSERIQCVHLKDMYCEGWENRMAPVYEGNIDFDAVYEALSDTNCEYALVEQDNCYGENPFDCLKKSFENLKSHGW